MALDLQDYTKTEWAPEMPITQERMENLEAGVYVNREALKSLDGSVSANTTALQNVATQKDLSDLYARNNLWS